MKKKVLLLMLFLVICSELSFAQITVGLIQHSVGSLDDGYVLFAPVNNTTTYLINKCGYAVNSWKSKYRPGLSVYLLPNGKLLSTGVDNSSPFVTGGGGGYIEIQDWAGNVEWMYKLSTQTECQHHDVKYLPNGNILAIVWEKKTFEELQTAGRNPALFNKDFWSEKILELRPIGTDSAEIVWQWKVWDHLVQEFDNTKENYGVVSENSQLMNVNCSNGKSKDVLADWLHFNSIDYNQALDQIALSGPFFDEIWIIDHSTTSQEAASHVGGKSGKGGDILYRWGNPAIYGHGTPQDQKLFYQHDVCWIPEGSPYAGNIMIFNNMRGPANAKFSSVDIIVTPKDESGIYEQALPFGPAEPVWSYTADGFYAKNISSAQQLQNGNVLICNGPAGTFFEIDKDSNKVWEYVNPVVSAGALTQGSAPLANDVFRCTFYPGDYSAFEGKDMSPKKIIENKNVNSYGCSLYDGVEESTISDDLSVYPNPSDEQISITTEYLSYRIEIMDVKGERILTTKNAKTISTKSLSNGIYFIYLISDSGEISFKKIIIER
jgi:hypothetical protein